MSPDFWKFWTGQTISNLGSSFTQWAVPLLVFQLTHSAVNLGIATAATFLPYLLFGLPLGAWMDRVDRKRAMIALDSVNALVILSIPLVAQFGTLNVWLIYAVTFISSSEHRTISAGVPTDLIRGDLVQWGAIAASVLIPAIPLALLYNAFLDRFIAGFTGGAFR